MMDVTSLDTNIYHVDEVDTCSSYPTTLNSLLSLKLSTLPNHPKLSTLSKTLYESPTNDGCHIAVH